MSGTILATRGLNKQYGRQRAVDNVDMAIEKGQIYGLVGRNGAGKTTMIRMIAGQTVPSGGEIELFGASSQSELQQMRRRTGVMVEVPSFYPYLTAHENLEYYRIQRGIPGKHVIEEALETVRLNNTGKKKFKQFSLGMKQRLGLALAMMNQPDVLLMDEPINGLDPEGIVEFRNILLQLSKQRETTILISSHILSELSNLATCYGFIEKGKMLEQLTAQELQSKCRACLELRVLDVEKTVCVLEKELNVRDFDVLPGGVIRLYNHIGQPEQIVRGLVEHGVDLTGIESKGTDLEEYFLSLLGGANYA